MKHLPALAFMKDEDGRYLYFNEACTIFYNEAPSERIGKTVDDLFPSEIAKHFKEKDKKVIPNKVSREVLQALENTLGDEWVSEDRAVIETYSRFSVDSAGTSRQHSKDSTMLPACIVLPQSTEDVQAIMRIANRFKVNVIPFTNGMIAFNGPTTPEPTICVHMSRMNRVLSIDEDNMTATLEAYADYGQLQAEAMKKDLWNGGTPLSTSLLYSSGLSNLNSSKGILPENITISIGNFSGRR